MKTMSIVKNLAYLCRQYTNPASIGTYVQVQALIAIRSEIFE